MPRLSDARAGRETCSCTSPCPADLEVGSPQMASSTLIHAACFAMGAVIGGGVATAVSNRKPLPALPSPPTSTTPQPIVEVGHTGVTRVAQSGTLVKVDSAVLKHGHPGPVSDLLVRKAYVAAYDRRLRHPAWVRGMDIVPRLQRLTIVIDCRTSYSFIVRKITA